MPARFILHIIVTLILLVIGWWLYSQLGSQSSGFSSIAVASYGFAALVFIFFSWLFYWFVHKLSTTAWMIALLVALAITVISTITLLYVSRENQKRLEQESLMEEQSQDSMDEQNQQTGPSNKIETLNLGE